MTSTEEDTKKPTNFETLHWQPMIDSIVEFIAASRKMLHVLNERSMQDEEIEQNTKKENKACAKIKSDNLFVDEIHFNEKCSNLGQTKKLKSKSFWDIAAEEISRQNKIRARSITPPRTSYDKPQATFSKEGSFVEGPNATKDQKKKDYMSIYQKKKSVTKELGKTENV